MGVASATHFFLEKYCLLPLRKFAVLLQIFLDALMQGCLLCIAFLTMLFSKDGICFMIRIQLLFLQFDYRNKAVGFPLLAKQETTCENRYSNDSYSEIKSFHSNHLLSRLKRLIFNLIVYNHNSKLYHILFSIAKKKRR